MLPPNPDHGWPPDKIEFQGGDCGSGGRSRSKTELIVQQSKKQCKVGAMTK